LEIAKIGCTRCEIIKKTLYISLVGTIIAIGKLRKHTTDNQIVAVSAKREAGEYPQHRKREKDPDTALSLYNYIR